MKIICLHQSAELYGSDRSFLQVISYLQASGVFKKITVILPRQGPLVKELEALQVEIQFLDISLLSKTYLKSFQWGKIIFPLLQFRQKIKLFSSYDILYVNTSVILDFYFFAPFIPNRKVIHIREIPTKWLSKILSFFIKRSGAHVIFNSFSTKESFDSFSNSTVIHNAFEGYGLNEIPPSLISTNDPLKILLIGRVNNWKGQDFAVEALSKLSSSNFILKIVGSTFEGNENILSNLKEMVENLQLKDKVEFVDFVDNPKAVYNWADVVIVPSKKPEPFGRIAIEAMSLGKPVVAAKHGGLPEIVSDGVSGYLFEPNNMDDFNRCILSYINDKELLKKHGNGSLRLFKERFSIENMHQKLNLIFTK